MMQRVNERNESLLLCKYVRTIRGIDHVTTFTAWMGKRTDISRRMGMQTGELTDLEQS